MTPPSVLRGGSHRLVDAFPIHRHKSTGIYWFKQRVPARLVAIGEGKSVAVTADGMPSVVKRGEYIKVSLRTKDAALAKRLAKEAQDEFDKVWLWFEQGPVKLTFKQITGLAGEMYHTIRAVLEDAPGEAAEWAQRRRDREANGARRMASPRSGLMIGGPSLEARLGSWVDGALAEHHLNVDDETRQRLLVRAAHQLGSRPTTSGWVAGRLLSAAFGESGRCGFGKIGAP